MAVVSATQNEEDPLSRSQCLTLHRYGTLLEASILKPSVRPRFSCKARLIIRNHHRKTAVSFAHIWARFAHRYIVIDRICQRLRMLTFTA